MTMPLFSGIGSQITGNILTGIGKWLGSEVLIRVGQQHRHHAERQRTMANARSVIQRSLRRTTLLH